VFLGLRNQAQAEALASAVSDPSSASYGKYLTTGQFQNQFSPAQSDVAAVKSWLQGQGFAIGYTPTNNHYVSAQGTVAQVERPRSGRSSTNTTSTARHSAHRQPS
jgi:subtilase family serine protease